MQNDLDDRMGLIENNNTIAEHVATNISLLQNKNITYSQVFEALFLIWSNKYEFEWMGDLWDVKFEYEEIFSALKNFDFKIFERAITSDISVYNGVSLIERKARFKHDNVVWYIHKNDVDPFPSNPHAHDTDQNFKLNLSNGDLWKVKRCVKRIKKKHLMQIRQKAAQVIEGELPELTV